MEENKLTVLELDWDKINQKAKESAEKAYLKQIEEYYTGWDSPFRKKVNEELAKYPIPVCVELPDIIAKINEGLAGEVNRIANEAVTMSLMPLVTKFLTRTSKEMKLSEILQEIANTAYSDFDEYNFEYQEHSERYWLNCELVTPDTRYEFTLHEAHENGERLKNKYRLLSFPRNSDKDNKYTDTMTIRKDGYSIEFPASPNVLRDEALRLLGRLVLNQTIITIDCDNFEDDMFEHRCHC